MKLEGNSLDVKLVPGKQGPLYKDTTELECVEVVITEQGMESGLPIVDFVMKDKAGKQYLFVTTGRLLQGVADVISAANKRNHGEEL